MTNKIKNNSMIHIHLIINLNIFIICQINKLYTIIHNQQTKYNFIKYQKHKKKEINMVICSYSVKLNNLY